MSLLSHARRAAVALLLLAPAAHAQGAAPASLVTDLYLNSAYVWRGVTFTNRPVVQADASLNVAAGQGAISGGAWINAEPRNYDGAHDLRLVAAGHSGPALTAITTWLDYTRTTGRVATTAGVTSYFYPAITNAAAAYNTSELYGRVAIAAPLSPKLAFYMDVEKVKGGYAEASIAAPLSAGPRVISFGLTVGASVGQSIAADQSYYFAHDGVAFGDLSATTSFTVRGASVSPTMHVLLDRDDATRIVETAGAGQKVKAWGGVTFGYAHAVTAPAKR